MTARVDANGKCVSCGRKIPTKRPDAAPGPRKHRVAIAEPEGETGVLDDLLTQLVAKYRPLWPDQISEVGEDHWRYKAIHFAAYAALTSNLTPGETGG